MNAVEESCVMGSDINSWGYGIPQFQDASNIFYWKLMFLLVVFLLVVLLVVIVLFLLYKYLKNKKQ